MATPAPPAPVAPGRLKPAGGQYPGAHLQTTVGSWTGAPDTMRFQWYADGVQVRDSGWLLRTWQDAYTVASSDIGRVITVEHSARNAAGDGGPDQANGQVQVELQPIPPAYVGHEAVFGPMVSVGDVYGALEDTIQTWLPTYLRERERLTGRTYASLPSIRGWRIFAAALDAYPADQLPLCVIVAPGVPDALAMNADGTLWGVLEIGVSLVVSARTTDETLDLATDYGAALRNCLEGHRTLGGYVGALHVIGERYDGLGTEDQRTIAAAEVIVSVRVDALSMVGGGPAEPFPDPAPQPDPGGPELPTVAVAELEIERE